MEKNDEAKKKATITLQEIKEKIDFKELQDLIDIKVLNDGTSIIELDLPDPSLEVCKTGSFYVDQVPGFDWDTFVKIKKTQDDSFEVFEKSVSVPEVLIEDAKQQWDRVEPLTFADCILEQNLEKRRVMFTALGPARLFNSVNKELLDKQTITKKRVHWDPETLEKSERVFDDTYELYRVDFNAINDHILKNESAEAKERREKRSRNNQQGLLTADLFSVRCWCTTTNREFWLMVNPSLLERDSKGNYDAIDAIASTIFIREKNPKRIYRQGDIVIVEKWGDKRDNDLYDNMTRISKQTYLEKMYSET